MGNCSNQKDLPACKAPTQTEDINNISWMDKEDKQALIALTKLGFYIDFASVPLIPANKNEKVMFEFNAWRDPKFIGPK